MDRRQGSGLVQTTKAETLMITFPFPFGHCKLSVVHAVPCFTILVLVLVWTVMSIGSLLLVVVVVVVEMVLRLVVLRRIGIPGTEAVRD